MKKALLVVIAFSLFVPLTAETFTGKAAVDEPTIYRDEYGVPHIFARTLEAAAFAVGYAQAEDRLEELLKNYRRATGTCPTLRPDHYRTTTSTPRAHEEVSREKYSRSTLSCVRNRIVQEA